MAKRQHFKKEADARHLAHGIEFASYVGGLGEPYYQSVMECTCGFETQRCLSWEIAGRQLDAHLAAVATNHPPASGGQAKSPVTDHEV